ncbi:hypothetical protein ACFLWW_03655 [Chloroflexota bacterium]
MSKFIDKLNGLSRGEFKPIGFGVRQAASPRPKIQLVAALAQESAGVLTDCVTEADAGLLCISRLSSGVKAIEKVSRACPDIPWGGWLKGVGLTQIKQMARISCDFLAFPSAGTPLSIFKNNEVGRILEVESALAEGLLRVVDELPVDAVLVTCGGQEGGFLTWQHLMLFQRFADLLTKPLLASIPSVVTADELRSLWEAGVEGVVIEIKAGQPPDRLKKLRQVVDALDFPPQRRHERAGPLLPRIGGEMGMSPEEEEEDE